MGGLANLSERFGSFGWSGHSFSGFRGRYVGLYCVIEPFVFLVFGDIFVQQLFFLFIAPFGHLELVPFIFIIFGCILLEIDFIGD